MGADNFSRTPVMNIYRALLTMLLLGGTVACGENSGPTGPTTTPPPPADTRIIRLGGTLDFGTVPVGQSVSRLLTISNDGNSTLTVTGMSLVCGGSFTSTFISGSIAPGSTQTATLRFAPQSAMNCSGLLTVTGNQTSGVNTISVAATSAPVARSMTGTWDGSNSALGAFVMVLNQAGSTVTGTYSDSSPFGPGRTDPAQPGTFFDPSVELRIKQGGFTDFTFRGTMDSTGRTVTGGIFGSGFTGQSFTLRKR
jgi:hypothetical protein